MTALNVFKQGLDKFPGEVTLLCGIARIYEVRFIVFLKLMHN
jgi:tetratricopeptide repeat protein 8